MVATASEMFAEGSGQASGRTVGARHGIEMLDSRLRHIVLFEPDPSGHRMTFVRYVVEALARHGGFAATLVTSPRACSAAWVAALHDTYNGFLSLHVINEPKSRGLASVHPKLGRQWASSNALRSAVATLRVKGRLDYVFVPFLDDYCLFPFGWYRQPFGTIPWGGIAIRPRFHLESAGAKVPRRLEDLLESFAYHRLLDNGSLTCLFSIDPFLAPYLNDPRVETICDPADIAIFPAERSWLPVADDAVVLLVYGHIDRRKAIDRLLTAAADSRVPHQVVVALVGTQEPNMTPILAGPAAARLREHGRLIEVARRVSDAEEASAFARADIVWGYYPGSYCSSGAMVRAGQSARALLATSEGLVGYLTQTHGSGLTAPEYDDEALLRQLIELASNADLRARLGQAGLDHFGSATGVAFGEQIVAHLDKALGISLRGTHDR